MHNGVNLRPKSSICEIYEVKIKQLKLGERGKIKQL
jgi:hypothetical protein